MSAFAQLMTVVGREADPRLGEISFAFDPYVWTDRASQDETS